MRSYAQPRAFLPPQAFTPKNDEVPNLTQVRLEVATWMDGGGFDMNKVSELMVECKAADIELVVQLHDEVMMGWKN